MKYNWIAVAGFVLVVAFAFGFWMGRQTTKPDAIAANPEIHHAVPASGTPNAFTPSSEALQGNAPACVDIHNVGPLAGKNGCVAGLVLRVYSSRSGNTFLDFCQDYRACPFT